MDSHGRSGSGIFFLIINLIFAAYFINYALNFYPIPAAIDPYNKWIIFAGGILIIFGAINHFRLKSMSRYRYQ